MLNNSQNGFKVKFRGVRGSYPTPYHNFLDYGGNTACVEVNVNNHLIILDAGTGIIRLGQELVRDYITNPVKQDINATILLSHTHLDHIQGLPFFQPLHLKSSSINIIGCAEYTKSIDEVLSGLLFEKTFPLDMAEIAANLSFGDINDSFALVFSPDAYAPELQKIESDEDTIPVDDEVVVSCLKSNSHPKDGVMLYKIAYKDKSLVYATDKESFVGGDKRLAMFARETDLLIHDAQYTTDEYINSCVSKQGYGHSTFDMALEASSQAHAKQLAFFHLDPNYNDDMLHEIENHYNKRNAFIAKEGQEIVLL